MSHDNKSDNVLHTLFQDLYARLPDSHVLCAESRFMELLDGVTWSNASTIHRLKVVKGVAYREDVDCERLVRKQQQHQNDIEDQCELQVFFLKPFIRNGISLSPASFYQLLKATRAPASYLEVLMDNNGLYHSYTVRGPSGLPADYYIFIKFPFGPFANGSFMLHHHFATGKTTVVTEVTNAQYLAETMSKAFSTSPSRNPHPLAPLALFVDHLRCLSEDERRDIDKSICQLESRSGVALHTFSARPRARISEYALLKKELHMKEALMAMAHHIFSFQAQMIEFATRESRNFAPLAAVPVAGRDLTTAASEKTDRQKDFVTASLALNGSMATWTLEQLKTLNERLRVQAQVIDGTITATDTMTMIRLAQNSQSDSNTMKAITILTMVFLPATFVCSLFSMGFFDFEATASESKLRVANEFWIYFVVTIPLTLVVLGTCAAWLRWSGRDRDSIGEFPTK